MTSGPRQRGRPPRQQRGDGDDDAADHHDRRQLDQRRDEHVAKLRRDVAEHRSGGQPPCPTAKTRSSASEPSAALTTWLIIHRGRLTAVARMRLERAVGLLGAHPQQHLDGVDRDGHAGHLDGRRAVGVDDLVGAAHARVPVGRRARGPGDLVDDGAEDQPEPEHADRPGEQRAALQPPDEPERAEQRGRGLGVPAALGEDAAADVAARGERARQRRPARRTRRRTGRAATSGRRRTGASAGPSPSATATPATRSPGAGRSRRRCRACCRRR